MPDDDDVPDWLRGLGVAGAAGAVAVALSGDEEEAPPEEEAPDWAEELDTIAVEETDAPPSV